MKIINQCQDSQYLQKEYVTCLKEYYGKVKISYSVYI